MIIECKRCIISYVVEPTDHVMSCPSCKEEMKKGVELAHEGKIEPGKFIRSLVLRPLN